MSDDIVGRWLFGKLPSLGDFVARGMDYAVRDRLDSWLTQEMEAARNQFGDEFESGYDISPAWNFVDCDANGSWSGGALCASQDRAGRRFPLIMAIPAPDAAGAAALSAGCLSAMCRAFADEQDADGLIAEEISAEAVAWSPHGPEWAILSEDGAAMVIAGRFPQGVIAKMVELAQ